MQENGVVRQRIVESELDKVASRLRRLVDTCRWPILEDACEGISFAALNAASASRLLLVAQRLDARSAATGASLTEMADLLDATARFSNAEQARSRPAFDFVDADVCVG
jgi:hypothetical protein